jgi:hypothetical protein
MKPKLLLILFFFGIKSLYAHDTIRTLIISEARIDNQHGAYVELTNVGSDTIDLSEFEFGKVGPWSPPINPDTFTYWFLVPPTDWLMLPKKNLAPGQSFVIAKINDYCTKMWVKNPEKYNRYGSKPEFLKLADLQVHIAESLTPVSQSLDSISFYASVMTVWNGAYCWYLRHHVSDTDSVVIDQVGGVYNDSIIEVLEYPQTDVAGFPDAKNKTVLIRKANVTKGNIDFFRSRGHDEYESEWIVVPFLKGSWEPERAVFWTVGNHGDYHLNSLTSSIITINWTDSTITVPWGVRNDDSIMYKFNRVPGIAWHYDYTGKYADSAYVSVRTGDKLTVYACGNQVEKIIFKIIALPPTTDDNLVIPKKVPNKYAFYKYALAFCEVTDKAPEMDTIRSIPFACRIDTLLKFLEKPASASWNFEWVDRIARADLKKGDILKVTSQSGKVKRYYIKPDPYRPSHNANLSAITWPDIPTSYKGMDGWNGDTIPNFDPSKTTYTVKVPWDVKGIPALTGLKQQVNAKIHVNRAINLNGNPWERTVTFIVTAEDDTSSKVYTVEFIKDKGACCVQHWKGEPFISQYVFRQDYNNYFCEIVNPSNFYNIDLSNYMVTFGYYTSATEAITRMSAADSGSFANRYNKYIPGYTWVDKIIWTVEPARVVPDAYINPILEPGKVFVMADIHTDSNSAGYPSQAMPYVNIDFQHNPWDNDLSIPGQAMKHWWGQKIMLFKILNDSIKQGLKAANDPRDFELIDVMGDSAGVRWVVGGELADHNMSWFRKPNIHKGNPVIQASFGTSRENSEWRREIIDFPMPWPHNIKMVADGIGRHYMNEVTVFNSTITSNIYRVSDGYSDKETIKGVTAGTIVNNFYSNIIKADTGQHLKMKRAIDDIILTESDTLSAGDTLIVVSSDSTNTTKYIVDCTPLSGDALLTSAIYTININGNDGVISNFKYGTKLKDVLNGVTLPTGASIAVIDADGAYVPLKILNFDTVYIDVMVNDQIRLEVTAENGNKIIYKLQPDVTTSDAFVTSNVYVVDNSIPLISLILYGTSVSGLLQNLIPATGATMKVIDKYGLERKTGYVCKDDKLVVTAANGVTTTSYYLSNSSCWSLPFPPYIYSNDYTVDQITFKISGSFSENTIVGDFIDKLIPIYISTIIKVVDSLENEKNLTDNLSLGDLVKVISSISCKVYSITYTIDFSTSNKTLDEYDIIKIFPNPNKGDIYISGLEPENNVRVYNTLGKLILEKVAVQKSETISMHQQPKGVYIIKVVKQGKKEICSKIIIN